jgi:hypothetical protein
MSKSCDGDALAPPSSPRPQGVDCQLRAFLGSVALGWTPPTRLLPSELSDADHRRCSCHQNCAIVWFSRVAMRAPMRDRNYWRIPKLAATLMLVSTVIAAVPIFAQDNASTRLRLEGLRIVAARHVTVEGKSGIEIDFDGDSAKRLLQFTIGAVGRRATLIVNGQRLATLRLLDPLTDGRILLSGELDHEAADTLFAPGASVDLFVE